jgi:hypothetical protein
LDEINFSETLPERLKFTTNGYLFLQYVNEEKSLCIFYNEKFLKYFEETKFATADGTFKSVSEEFKELYTFHIEINNSIFPVIYILFKSKAEKLYIEAFHFLLKETFLKSTSDFFLILNMQRFLH